VLILATVPLSVSDPVPLPPTVTLPPLDAVKVPALAAIVTVSESPSTSDRVRADRSKSLAVSSVTVTSAGTPDAVGASFTGVTLIVTVSAVPSTVPSFGVTVRVAAVVSLDAVVYSIFDVSLR
jgi:hypothetical protein